jgi:hypothetical protein
VKRPFPGPLIDADHVRVAVEFGGEIKFLDWAAGEESLRAVGTWTEGEAEELADVADEIREAIDAFYLHEVRLFTGGPEPDPTAKAVGREEEGWEDEPPLEEEEEG